MTEEEYIIATDLAKVRIARSAISDVMPLSNGVIQEGEWRHVMQILGKWADALYGKAHLTIEEDGDV